MTQEHKDILQENKLTVFDIGLYKAIHKHIDKLVYEYYVKFIYCEWHGYHLDGWKLTEDDKIRIIYSYIDYHDEPCCEDRVLTLDEIYEDLDE
jgi:hypothetical protein